MRALLRWGVLAGALVVLGLLAWRGAAQDITLAPLPNLRVAPGSTLRLAEEFFPGSTVTVQVGAYGWVVRNIGGAPAITHLTGTANAWGVTRITTSTTQTQGGNVGLDGNNAAFIPPLSTHLGPLDAYARMALGATTTIRVRVGLQAAATATAQPTDGVFIRYDTSAGFADTAFMFCRRAASDAEACITTGVAADTNFHTFHLYTVSGAPSHIYADVDGGTPVCMTTAASGCGLVSTSFPAVALAPVNIVVTDAVGAAKFLDLDYWGLLAQGLTR